MASWVQPDKGDGFIVSYGMTGPGSHMCARIGRSHMSNKVHFIIYFRGGEIYQKCFDPCCARKWHRHAKAGLQIFHQCVCMYRNASWQVSRTCLTCWGYFVYAACRLWAWLIHKWITSCSENVQQVRISLGQKQLLQAHASNHDWSSTQGTVT